MNIQELLKLYIKLENEKVTRMVKRDEENLTSENLMLKYGEKIKVLLGLK